MGRQQASADMPAPTPARAPPASVPQPPAWTLHVHTCACTRGQGPRTTITGPTLRPDRRQGQVGSWAKAPGNPYPGLEVSLPLPVTRPPVSSSPWSLTPGQVTVGSSLLSPWSPAVLQGRAECQLYSPSGPHGPLGPGPNSF